MWLAHGWSLPLAPLMLVQALYVKRTIPRLPEPAGARVGELGQGRPLRLLITGDSAAAGVGVEHQSQALAGQLSGRLAADFALHWSLEALTGRTTLQALAHLHQLPAQPFDIAVISLGVNDVTSGISARRWINRLRQLIELLTSRFQVRQVLLSPVPPMHLFPALPQPLRAYLGARARHFNRALERYVGGEPRCLLAQPELTGLSTASDGFHLGVDAYAAWADALAGHIRASHA
ncbi:MAG: SGNH/GDSL hydrolase family protein [Perlucidibaca sp.]